MFEHIRSFRQPTTTQEAIRLLAGQEGEACLLAGGTDVVLRAGPSVRVLVDISRLGLSYIKRKGNGLRIGATTTMAALEESVLVRLTADGILAKAAASCGSPQTRNMATIGGNLANASPAADTATPLLVMDAEVVLKGLRTVRTIPLDKFFAGPHQTTAHRELLIEIVIPGSRPQTTFAVQRLARTEMDIAIVSVAAAIRWDSAKRCTAVRIALGAVAPCSMRARRAESILEGQVANDALVQRAAEMAAQEISPITDARASADYRRHVSQVLVRRALEECLERLTIGNSQRASGHKGGSR